jgi:hypothetical protein
MLPIMEHPTNHEPTDEEWRTLARQASEERDPNKLLDLAEQIVEKFDEEIRRKLRLVSKAGHPRGRPLFQRLFSLQGTSRRSQNRSRILPGHSGATTVNKLVSRRDITE